MKRFIVTFVFFGLCAIASAQIQYLPTENRNHSTIGNSSSGIADPILSQPRPQYSEPAPQIIRTTAYLISGEDIYKVPIKVQKKGNYYKVIEQYVDETGFGGRWKSISGSVQKCTPAVAMGNPLEGQFMYKAMVGMNWYYFDL